MVWKTSTKIPHLEDVSVAQYIAANGEVMLKLLLHPGLGISDHWGTCGNMSCRHTIKVGEFAQIYTTSLVMIYDHRCWKRQADDGFAWGTDQMHMPNFHLVRVTLSTAIVAICILSTCSLDTGTMRKQFTYWASSIHIDLLSAQYGYWVLWQYALVLLPSLHNTTLFKYRPWCHQSSFGSLCNFMPYPFCMRKEVFVQFCHDNYIREKKNSKTRTQKKIGGIKAYLKNVEGWQQPYIAYCHNSHIAHSICTLLAQYVYCLRIVPISKLPVHNMHIARNSHAECRPNIRKPLVLT